RARSDHTDRDTRAPELRAHEQHDRERQDEDLEQIRSLANEAHDRDPSDRPDSTQSHRGTIRRVSRMNAGIPTSAAISSRTATDGNAAVHGASDVSDRMPSMNQ